MELISTGGGPSRTWTFTEALFLGQAPDGGLFVPASIPCLPEEGHAALASLTFPERAFVVARHFLAGEVPDDVLRTVVHEALNFPVPLREIEPGVHMLELFHVPTHAFKDVGARFMARMMSAVRRADAPPVTILTATSGDTGGAVAHAFHGVSGVRVLVFFPLGKINPRQEAQITTLGGNVTAGLLGLRRELARRPGARGVMLATAHPAKFAETVEPLIGESLPLPTGMARVMDRPRRSIEIAPELDAVREVLGEVCEACASVAGIDGPTIGDGRPGPMTERLSGLYGERTASTGTRF